MSKSACLCLLSLWLVQACSATSTSSPDAEMPARESPGDGSSPVEAAVSESPSPTPAQKLGRAREAAKAFAREHGFPAEKIARLAEPPLMGPITIDREGRDVTAFRWLGHGRGADYVQAEVDDRDGSIVVTGGSAHNEYGPFRPEVDLGLELVLDVWPEERGPENELRLRIAVRNISDTVVSSTRAIGVLTAGTLYVRTPPGETVERQLGLWRGPAPPDISPQELASHCASGFVSGFVGSDAPGRYILSWESSGLRSNDLVIERNQQGVWRRELSESAQASTRPHNKQAPRVDVMVDGLKQIITDLETSKTTPNRAFDQIKVLEEAVGPPGLKLPPRETDCTSDADCALSDLAITGGIFYTCCPSLVRTAGTVEWVRRYREACRSYERLRGRNSAILLPECGIPSGPISATTALCKFGRCVPCMEPNDGSDIVCHDSGS